MAEAERMAEARGAGEHEDMANLLPAGARMLTRELKQVLARGRVRQLQSTQSIPPDGLCLAYCCCAATAVDGWKRTARSGHGFIEDRAQERAWKEKTQVFLARVLSLMELDGNADRAAEMRAGSYPGDDEIQYYAKVLGGTIIVHAEAFNEHMIPLVFGDEPLMLEVTHVCVADDAGHESGHFELSQVWHAAAPSARPRAPCSSSCPAPSCGVRCSANSIQRGSLFKKQKIV